MKMLLVVVSREGELAAAEAQRESLPGASETTGEASTRIAILPPAAPALALASSTKVRALLEQPRADAAHREGVQRALAGLCGEGVAAALLATPWEELTRQ